MATFHQIPLRWVGPVQFAAPFQATLELPLVTYETTLWPSIARGAKVSVACGGIHVHVASQCMTRSITLEAPSAMMAAALNNKINLQKDRWSACCQRSSRFAKLIDIHSETVGPLIFVRFGFTTGDAAGHNMVTKASEEIMQEILASEPQLRYVSLSGNYCTDKKVSAINGILGRGFRVISELNIDRAICEKLLHTTPEKIVDLHIKKNLIGSTLAGSLRSANAHFANMLLAFFLATGQDGANIVEGSQGMTHALVDEKGNLAFSCTLPSLIVGSVGHGKNELESVRANLKKIGCLDPSGTVGASSQRLAALAAGVVLCGELSLLAALTCPGELMHAHLHFERKGYESSYT